MSVSTITPLSTVPSQLPQARSRLGSAISPERVTQEPTQAPSPKPSSVTATEPTGATSESSDLTAEKSQQSSQSSLIDARKKEAAEAGKVITEYVDLYTFGFSNERAEVLPRWIFGKAITKLKDQADEWTDALLSYLQRRCKRKVRQAIRVTLQKTEKYLLPCGELPVVEKLLSNESIGMIIYMPSKLQDPEILLGDDEREEFITLTARTFIHETAHVFQLEKHGNYSYPWRADHPTTTVERGKWPKGMEEAYNEFEELGEKKKKELRELPLDRRRRTGREQWSDVFDALNQKEYFDVTIERDWRAREFVSHLIELVHLWGQKRFTDLLPKCAGVLASVIKGEELD
jgi:hypothetical protein